jgi:hypothetical protein
MRWSALPLVALVVACTRGAPPAPPAPVPPPVSPVAPLPAPNPSTSTANPDLLFCVVRNGRLEQVVVHVLSFRGDTVTNTGVPVSRVYPSDSTYALNAGWYTTSQAISVMGVSYVKYGLPRILATTDVVPVAAYRGVTVFAEPGDDPRPGVIYVPVRPGCEFQPYTVLAKM